MSNYSHVFQEFRPIVEQSNEDRLYFLEEDRWIGYPAANDLLDQLKGFLTLPKRSRMPNLLVLSKPNNGKTSIINQFFKLYGEGYVNAENNAVKPVIIVQAPVSPDEKLCIWLFLISSGFLFEKEIPLRSYVTKWSIALNFMR